MALSKFKQNAGLSERVRGVQEALTQHTDLASEEAIEMPNSTDLVFKSCSLHRLISFLFASVNYLVALVKDINEKGRSSFCCHAEIERTLFIVLHYERQERRVPDAPL